MTRFLKCHSLSGLSWYTLYVSTPALVQRMVGISLPVAEHWMVISLSSSRHWAGWGVGVNFSFSETQVKTPHAQKSKHCKCITNRLDGRVYGRASFVQLAQLMKCRKADKTHVQTHSGKSTLNMKTEAYHKMRSNEQRADKTATHQPIYHSREHKAENMLAGICPWRYSLE